MAGRICKIILNDGRQALADSLEEILLDPSIVEEFSLPETKRQELIQAMANIDIASMNGDTALLPAKGLLGIVVELEAYGLVTDEVWKIYARP